MCAQKITSQFDRAKMLLQERVGKYYQVKMSVLIDSYAKRLSGVLK